MIPGRTFRSVACALCLALGLGSLIFGTSAEGGAASRRIDSSQIPTWSPDDLEFFLHGSMGTEVIPVRVFGGFVGAFPDLFGGVDVAAFGLMGDEASDFPIGVSSAVVQHLGGVSAIGVNCASCHLGEVGLPGQPPIRVVGMTSHFDAEAFFGAVTVAMLRSAEPNGMMRFLKHYVLAGGLGDVGAVEASINRQIDKIESVVRNNPFGSVGIKPGQLHKLDSAALAITPAEVIGGADLAPTVRALLRTFYNMRTALHLPAVLPSELPPPGGPGRNNAFGLLSQSLFGVAITHAPVKFGLVWNVAERGWVQWDGNTQQPIARNLAASLGLGAPIVDNRALLDLALVQRHTALTEMIRAPTYPRGWPLDTAAANRGAAHYQRHCAVCHDVESKDPQARLHNPFVIGTDIRRARQFDRRQEALHDKLFRTLRISGYTQGEAPPFRATGKYWAVDLAGVWARSPYLHNGSVRTMWELLSPAKNRAQTFWRGTSVYDPQHMGFVDDGSFRFDVSVPGNSKAGHEYGADLADNERRDLIEYLKTL